MVIMDQQTLHFSSKTENISQAEKLVEEICCEYKINEDLYGNMLVALTEAVNNAIHHGNKSDPKKQVNLTFMPEEKELNFIVKDEGTGFDFNNLPDPTDPENLEKENGRGIFLMKHLADKIDFDDQGRSVKLTFKIKQN